MSQFKIPEGPISIAVCSCGTNHNAIDTALAIFKQHLSPAQGNCPVYAAAVVEAMQNIAAQLLQQSSRRIVGAEPGKHHELAAQKTAEIMVGLETDVFVGFYKNDAANKRMADFFCSECKSPEGDRADIEAGPHFSQLLQTGYRPEGHITLGDLLSAIIGKRN